jgi:chromosome partitioning protein
MMATPPLAERRRMQVLVLANRKGGVGTTATACQLLFYLRRLGQRMLFLDLDHQGNSTRCLRKSLMATQAGFTTSALFQGRASSLPSDACVLVGADDELSTLERRPDEHNDFANRLISFLDQAGDDFDFCIVDTNPNPDIRYAAAVIAADYLLSPIELKQEAIDGIGTLLNHGRYGVHKVKAALNPKLDFIGILPNMVEANPFQRANLQQLVNHYPTLLIPVVRDGCAGYAYIPNRTAMAEAQAAGVPLWLLRQAREASGDGVDDAAVMPIRSSARDAWREIKPSFEAIARRMGVPHGA